MLVKSSSHKLKNGEVVELRSPAAEDAAAVLGFLRKNHPLYWRNMARGADAFENVTVEEEASFLARMAESASDFCLAAFGAEGACLGLLGIWQVSAALARHCGRVVMSVAVDWQGYGLGRALLENGIAAAREVGMWNLRLEVRTFNRAAMALYEKCGFVKVGELRQVADIEGTHFDEFIYQRLETPGDARG